MTSDSLSDPLITGPWSMTKYERYLIMAGWFVRPPDGPVGQGNADFDALSKAHPYLAQVLAGCKASEGQPEQKPLTISVFFDSGKLKFSMSHRHSTDVAFGTLDASNALGEALDVALAEGHYEWKQKRR